MRFVRGMKKLRPEDLRVLDRAHLAELSAADLLETCVRLRALAIEQAERLNRHSGNSSKPPSSEDPYRRGAKAPAAGGAADDGASGDGASGKTPSRPPGRQKGAPGKWRSTPLVSAGEVDHVPDRCAVCSQAHPVVAARRCASAHHVLELEHRDGGIGVTCHLHRYFAIRCGCGHETVAAPGQGNRSEIKGRCR